MIARQLLGRFKKAPTVLLLDGMGEPPVLSVQEQGVLEMSGMGYSYEEIARLMGLSRHTIETHVQRICRKLHVHSKVEALYEARTFGLVRD